MLQGVERDARGRLLLIRRVRERGSRKVLGGLIVTRLRADGTLDRTHGRAGSVRLRDLDLPFEPVASTLDGEGRLLLAGNAARLVRPAAVARLTTDGRLDRRFSSTGHVRAPLGRTGAFRIRGSELGGISVHPGRRILLSGVVYDDDPGQYPASGYQHLALTQLVY